MRRAPGSIDRGRYRRITRFFVGVALRLIWWDVLLRRILPGRVSSTRPDRYRRLARRFRELAVEMGGVMIKAGQFLSSRVDVLPPEITEELAGLQDEVPSEPIESIRRVIAEELGRPPDEVFDLFEESPQAAASLGQTHRARLPGDGDSRSSIVKVQRPGIERLVETDLAALRAVARWLMLYPAIRHRANLPALVDEFARTTWEEVDYLSEAENAERFAEMFEEDPGVRIPAVRREFTTRRVLTLEDVERIKITDFAALEAAGISRAQVAQRLFDVYLRQVFEEGFFHADPHPGNLFVCPTDQPSDEEGRPFELIFVDFGMVGRVPTLMGEQLREILLSLALRDARRMVQAYQKLDFFLPGADLRRVEEAIGLLLDRFWGMSMEELAQVDYVEMHSLALQFRDLLFELPFQVPKDFIFLGRAAGILSGLATSLDPHFSPWKPIEAYGKRLLQKQRGWPAVRDAIQTAGESLRPLLTLPLHLEDMILHLSRGDLTVRVAPDRSLERRLQQIEGSFRGLLWGIVFAASLVAGTLLYLDQQPVPAAAGWALAGVALLWAMITGRRR